MRVLPPGPLILCSPPERPLIAGAFREQRWARPRRGLPVEMASLHASVLYPQKPLCFFLIDVCLGLIELLCLPAGLLILFYVILFDCFIFSSISSINQSIDSKNKTFKKMQQLIPHSLQKSRIPGLMSDSPSPCPPPPDSPLHPSPDSLMPLSSVLDETKI